MANCRDWLGWATRRAASRGPRRRSAQLRRQGGRIPRLLLALWFTAGGLPTAAWAATQRAAQHVREGLESFRAGDWQAAQRAFADADVALPDNERIAFDQGCVLAAQGDAEKAIERFRKAATSRDADVVGAAHYNLGCVAAAQAKAAFGEKPEETQPEARSQGLQLLGTAIGHYRDCLRVAPHHSDARQNLELLRLWIKHMQDLWTKRDRERERQDLDVLAYLLKIEGQQTALRVAAKSLAQEPDSPRHRQLTRQTQTAQRELTDEIEPLKDKITKALAAGPGAKPAPTAGPSPAADMQKAASILGELADLTRSSMTAAADRLGQRELPRAIDAQTEALERLNELYMGLAPFEHILPRATQQEDELVKQSQQAVQLPDDKSAPKEAAADFAELSRTQGMVANWTQALTLKAKQQLEQTPAVAGPEEAKPTAPPQDAAQPPTPSPQAVRAALQKAVGRGPKIRELCAEAAKLLERSAAQAALPKQEEALKLLREIAESLPKPPSQKPDKPQEQPKDKQNKPSPENPASDKPQPQQPSPQDLSRQQAEAVLNRAKQREREHRDREKQMQQYLHGRVPVDKDW